jgi:hypothetical protein
MSNWLGVAADPQGVAAPAGAERLLSDAARRATMPGLAPSGLAALAVRFATAPPPGARPHHRRVARAILDEAVLHHGGQVFGLGNGDLVLLAPASALRAAGRGDALPETLGRLLGEVGIGLVTVWRLPAERERLLAYAADRLVEGGRPPTDPPAASRERLREAADPPLLPALLHRQTAVLLGGGRMLQPLFREIAAGETALKAQPGAEALEPDSYLLRHLARQLEVRLLAVLPGEIGRRGALDAVAGPRLHLNLSPAGVMSEGFAGFAELCAAHGVRLGVEIALVEAAADPDGLDAAHRRLAAARIAFVLDGVSPHALRLTEPGGLGAALVKLDWAPGLPSCPAAEQHAVEAALARLGPERVVLAGADGEAALQWGMAHGLRRFQGRHVDAMLAASRLAVCPGAARCALRQCVERAGAVAAAGRVGCTNHTLLDAGVPDAGVAGS